MGRGFVPSLTGRAWWWVFTLFIAMPAIALALLGIRSIRADGIERDQRLREEQTQLARLADAALAAAFDRFTAGAVNDRSVGESAAPARGTPFILEGNGVLAFPVDRVYFGPLGAVPSGVERSRMSQVLAAEVAPAQAAEAQQRYGEARRLYERIGADPHLSAWAALRVAIVDAEAGARSRLSVVGDPDLALSDARTPAGVPLAVAAASYGRSLAAFERARFAPLIDRTLRELHRGRWWLTADQRRAYAAELGEETADVRLELLRRLEPLVRRAARGGPASRAVPDQTGGTPSAPDPSDAHVLIVFAAAGGAPDAATGIALAGDDLAASLTAALEPLLAGRPFGAAIRDRQGAEIWGELEQTDAWHDEPLESVDGWQFSFSRSTAASSGLPRYALAILPVVMLATGLLMTAWIVARDLALARLQSTFVAAVTHEFKSPITSIRLLVERLAGGRIVSPDAAAGYYEAVRTETDRLEALVNRLLEAQALQKGQRRYAFRPASLGDLAAEVVARFRPQAEARNIRLDLSVEAGVPELPLDREAVAGAAGNLIDNAIKYSPSGAAVSTAVRAAAGEVRLEVADEGIGVEPDDRIRIFEPFYRSRRGDAASVQGTGLGLSLVKAAAEAHGGSVEVTSNGTRGSRFTLRLPVERPASAGIEPRMTSLSDDPGSRPVEQ